MPHTTLNLEAIATGLTAIGVLIAMVRADRRSQRQPRRTPPPAR